MHVYWIWTNCIFYSTSAYIVTDFCRYLCRWHAWAEEEHLPIWRMRSNHLVTPASQQSLLPASRTQLPYWRSANPTELYNHTHETANFGAALLLFLKQSIQSFPRHIAHTVALISAFLALSQQPYLIITKSRVHRAVCLFTPPLSLVFAAPSHGRAARLSWVKWLVTIIGEIPSSKDAQKNNTKKRPFYHICNIFSFLPF